MSVAREAVPKSPSRDLRASARLAALAAAAVLLASAGGTGGAATEGSRIVLTDDTTGFDDLFLLDPVAGARHALTATAAANEVQADWSPDGSRLAFASDRGGLWRIWVLDPASGAAEAITSGPEDLDPDWSPGGDALLFTAIFNRDTTDQASFLMLTDGAGAATRPLIALMDTDRTIGQPKWSPDGRRIVFCVGGPDRGSELYAVNHDGSGARLLAAHPGWEDLDPAWSPDGRRIAFASGRVSLGAQATRHDVWLLDPELGLSGTIFVDPALDLRRPGWSPDGAALVIDARPAGSPNPSRLHLLPIAGGPIGPSLTSGRDADWSAGPGGPTPATATAAPSQWPDRTGTPGPETGTPPPVTDLPPPPTLPPFPTFGPAEPTSPLPPPTFPGPSATASAAQGRVWLPVARKPDAGEAGRR